MESLVHAVVVLAAPLQPLLFRERLPHAVLVAPCARLAHRDGAQTTLPDRTRERDVEIAVEAVALVEPADLDEGSPPGREAVALDRMAFAGSDLVEVLEVSRAQSPRPDRARLTSSTSTRSLPANAMRSRATASRPGGEPSSRSAGSTSATASTAISTSRSRVRSGSVVCAPSRWARRAHGATSTACGSRSRKRSG